TFHRLGRPPHVVAPLLHHTPGEDQSPVPLEHEVRVALDRAAFLALPRVDEIRPPAPAPPLAGQDRDAAGQRAGIDRRELLRVADALGERGIARRLHLGVEQSRRLRHRVGEADQLGGVDRDLHHGTSGIGVWNSSVTPILISRSSPYSGFGVSTRNSRVSLMTSRFPGWMLVSIRSSGKSGCGRHASVRNTNGDSRLTTISPVCGPPTPLARSLPVPDSTTPSASADVLSAQPAGRLTVQQV